MPSPPTALLDANVLFPAPLRDLLIRLGMAGLLRVRWTDRILDEVFRNLAQKRPELDAARLQRTRELMNEAVRDVLVADYEAHLAGLSLPDPNDHHVLAAAIACDADLIITRNVKDFPPGALSPHGLYARPPDQVVSTLAARTPARVAEVVAQQAHALRSPPMSVPELLVKLEQNGLKESVGLIRSHLGAYDQE